MAEGVSGRWRNKFGIQVGRNRRNSLARRKDGLRQARLRFADEISQGLDGHSQSDRFPIARNSAQNAYNAMSFRINDDAATCARMNRLVTGQAVVKCKQAVGGLALECGLKPQQAAERTDVFLRVRKDINLLANFQIVETESDAMMMRHSVAQFEDSEVAVERVLHGTDGCAVVHGGAFVVRAGSEVQLNDFLSFDFAGPRQHSHVIIGRDETAGGVQAESRAEVAFQTETEILYFSDRYYGAVEVRRGHNSGTRCRCQLIGSVVSGRCRQT